MLWLWNCCDCGVFDKECFCLLQFILYQVISHNVYKNDIKYSNIHTNIHTKFIENTVRKAENIAARSHGCDAVALKKSRLMTVQYHHKLKKVNRLKKILYNFFYRKNIAFYSETAYNNSNRTPHTSHCEVSQGETFFLQRSSKISIPDSHRLTAFVQVGKKSFARAALICASISFWYSGISWS